MLRHQHSKVRADPDRERHEAWCCIVQTVIQGRTPPGGSGHSHYDSGAECWIESGEWMIGWSRRHAGYGGIESIIMCGC